MKKTISLLISFLILMTTLCVFASAASETEAIYTYEVDDVEFTVEFEDNNLTANERSIVAEKLVGLDNNEAQTYGLGCVLFGHDYKYTTASVVEHKVYPNVPRCRKHSYDVTYCEDCDYVEQTLVKTEYITCCPVD